MSRNNSRNRQRRKMLALYADLPRKAAGLGDLLTFAQWLQSTGRTPVCDPDAPFETARWINLEGRTAIIYHNARGELTWTAEAAEDFRAYLRWARPQPFANDEPMKPGDLT